MDDKKQEEEEEEAISHQMSVKEWEQIQSPPPPISPLQSHHIRWEILLDTPRNDFSVFPPSNHEGLHISPPQHHQQLHALHNSYGDITDDVDVNGEDAIKDEHEEDPDVPKRVSSSPCEVGSRRALDSLLNSGFLVLRDALMRKLRLGFWVLRPKLFWVASLVRSRIGVNWGVAALCWSSLWHVWWWWRWRQRLKRERRDSLILLLQGQNEKICQLSEQITRLNELLLSRRRILIPDSS
ncbi:hypothetical protein Scep_017207 [Stephania cephalantha]|uniref:Uncharacterized protein n=1 Tax=Stephania cephalantha TaxID=152367 RepID=A0AAP0IP12_9MAGN